MVLFLSFTFDFCDISYSCCIELIIVVIPFTSESPGLTIGLVVFYCVTQKVVPFGFIIQEPPVRVSPPFLPFILCVCVFCLRCICVPCANDALGGLKSGPDTLELELQMVVNNHVGTGNQNQVFCKSSQCSNH